MPRRALQNTSWARAACSPLRRPARPTVRYQWSAATTTPTQSGRWPCPGLVTPALPTTDGEWGSAVEVLAAARREAAEIIGVARREAAARAEEARQVECLTLSGILGIRLSGPK